MYTCSVFKAQLILTCNFLSLTLISRNAYPLMHLFFSNQTETCFPSDSHLTPLHLHLWDLPCQTADPERTTVTFLPSALCCLAPPFLLFYPPGWQWLNYCFTKSFKTWLRRYFIILIHPHTQFHWHTYNIHVNIHIGEQFHSFFFT